LQNRKQLGAFPALMISHMSSHLKHKFVHRLEDTRRQLRAVEEQLGAKAKEAEDLARARNRDKVWRDLTGWWWLVVDH
jgi:hypothetical protein